MTEPRVEAVARKRFPILGVKASIDWQLVEDHGKQAKANHYQTVERLAKRGGLSWCELHAVLHNRQWQKMDENTAIVECRALEARYLAAIAALDAQPASDLIERLRAMVSANGKAIVCNDQTTKMMCDTITEAANALAANDAEIARLTKEAEALNKALAKISPIRVHDGPDYAEVYFADGVTHSTQAMTMNPQDWRDIAAKLGTDHAHD